VRREASQHRLHGEPCPGANGGENVECLIERTEASSERKFLDVLTGDQNVHQRFSATQASDDARRQ
jgi:hypothetical protein